MRGRPPVPTAIKKARGTDRADRAYNEPKPPAARSPRAPAHLDDAARKIWPRMVRVLSGMRLLSDADLDLLAAYCQVLSRWADAEQHIKEDGAIVKAPSGYPIANPYLSIANKCLEQIHKIGAEFGLSPSSRTRLHVPMQKADPDPDGKDRFFRRLNAAGVMAIAGDPKWEAHKAAMKKEQEENLPEMRIAE